MFRFNVRRLVTFNTISLISAIVIGGGIGLLIPIFSNWSIYRLLFVVFILLIIPILLMIIGDVKRTLLVSLAFTIPFSFSLAPFGTAPYHEGGAQPLIAFQMYDFPLMGLAAIWLLEVLAQRKSIPKTSIFWAAVLWITWSSLSMVNSTNLRLSFFEILRMAKLCLLMVIVATFVRDKKDILAILYTLLFGLIIQSIICAVQYTTGSDLGLGLFTVGGLNRVSGTIGWPNTVGAYAAAITAIAFILFFNNPGDKIKKASLVAGFAGLFMLIITFSRGAWVAFIITLTAGIFVSFQMKWLQLKDISRLTLAGLIGVIVALPFINGILTRVAETNLEQGAIQARFQLNEVAYNMIITYPLLGIGINTFVEVERHYDPTGVTKYLPYPVHNIYLLVAAETGLAGLGLFLIFIGTIIYAFLRVVKSSDRLISSSAIGLLCGLAAILISNLADGHLRTEVLFALFWFLAGLGVALNRIMPSPQNPREIAS